MKKEELREEIIDLKWRALPYYERLAYNREICKGKTLQLRELLRAQKWQVRHTKTIILVLFVASIFTLFYPNTSCQLSVFLGSSAMVLIAIDLILEKRLQLLYPSKHVLNTEVNNGVYSVNLVIENG